MKKFGSAEFQGETCKYIDKWIALCAILAKHNLCIKIPTVYILCYVSKNANSKRHAHTEVARSA